METTMYLHYYGWEYQCLEVVSTLNGQLSDALAQLQYVYNCMNPIGNWCYNYEVITIGILYKED